MLLAINTMKWAILYIVVVLTANYTALWFIPLPVFGLVAIGTILFGVTFTARDYVHRLGRAKVYIMIFVAALSSAVLVWIGATPYRIIIASITAIVISEGADTEIYQKLISKPWFVRVTGSNLLSVPLDTILFNLLSFFRVFPSNILISIIIGEIIVKYIIGLLVAVLKTGGNK